MIETLSQIQDDIQQMRDAVIKEGSVIPEDDALITSRDAKKKVLWYVDRVAAVVAGAHRHMSNVERDDFWSSTDKEEIRVQIVDRLRQDLEWLPGTMKDYVYCFHKHFGNYETAQYPLTPNGLAPEDLAERRQKVSEILDQLELLDREVDDRLGMLAAEVT